VNGKTVASPSYSKNRVELPGDLLTKGANKVAVNYRQKFSRDGTGLYRFKDPEDGRNYTWTQFEPFYANHMFPCFDQPDLKATMKLKVRAPGDWHVISTTRETSAVGPETGERTWDFPETARLSTYLFSLHAGPYHMWEDKVEKKTPLRLFVRQSLKKYIDPDHWFVPTRQGLKFFGDYFAYAYPFHKYDQIIVPDFNSGAMENVGAVTFSERYVHRGPSTYEQRQGLADTVLHELAHMWFGDLVTMQWWNGLWLNESFASYMAALAMVEATEFKDSWLDFYSGMKSWAYWEDQLVTTHPIEGAVADTQSAFARFDGITYGKGASVLKQLAYYIGPSKFRDGLRVYFKKHAYGNTQIRDFLAALEGTSKKDLGSWSRQWLETSGVDTIEAVFTCDEGKIGKFELKATPPAGQDKIRPHRTLVGLYAQTPKGVAVIKSANIEYSGPLTRIKALEGAQCPLAVYPNLDDHDYAKVRLDKRTLAFVRTGLPKIKSTMARMLFWPNLFEMVRDGELSPQDYLMMAGSALKTEPDTTIASSIIRTVNGRLSDGFGSAFQFLPQDLDRERRARDTISQRFSQMFWDRLLASPPKSDWQRILLNAYVGTILKPETGTAELVELLDGKRTIKGLELDQDLRWNIVVRLNSIGHKLGTELLNAEKARDKSERGIQQAMAAEASRPTAGVKTEWFKTLTENKELTLARIRAVAQNLYPAWQDTRRAELGTEFFAKLPSLIASRELSFVRQYVGLVPAVCTQASAKSVADYVASNSATLPPAVIKSLRVSAQEADRCATVRAKATQPPAPPATTSGATTFEGTHGKAPAPTKKIPTH
jgi:aminopeptidase N